MSDLYGNEILIIVCNCRESAIFSPELIAVVFYLSSTNTAMYREIHSTMSQQCCLINSHECALITKTKLCSEGSKELLNSVKLVYMTNASIVIIQQWNKLLSSCSILRFRPHSLSTIHVSRWSSALLLYLMRTFSGPSLKSWHFIMYEFIIIWWIADVSQASFHTWCGNL